MGVSSLAEVLSVWTGYLSVTQTSSGTVVDIYPYTRDSVASFMVRVAHELFVQLGITSTIEVDALGIITMRLSDTVDYEAFGLVGDFLQISDATGTTTIQGVGAFSGAFISEYGMRLDGPLVAWTRGQPNMYGAAATSGVRRSGRSTLIIYDDTIIVPAFGASDWDLWHDGRIQGRFRVDETRRVPLSRSLRTNTTTCLRCDVEEVA